MNQHLVDAGVNRQALDRMDVLAARLRTRGPTNNGWWKQGMREVLRHRFVPSTGWAIPDLQPDAARTIDIGTDPASWWDAVYSDSAIITQADDGTTDPATGTGAFTSSISAPGVVGAFLELLNLREGDAVLEIGTGTGWTAGLLSWRAGDNHVTSVEVDPAVANQAKQNLAAAGYSPTLIVGNGADGWPARAPYDRVHATCQVDTIPWPWIAQTNPGGVIVLPWTSGSPRGHMVRLDVTDQHTAIGRFAGPASYMMMRSRREAITWRPHHVAAADTQPAQLDPRAIVDAGPGMDLALAAKAPGIGVMPAADRDGRVSLLMFETGKPDTGSWAACDPQPARDNFLVTHYGPRPLWDEVTAAYRWWTSIGHPGTSHFRIRVNRDGQHVEFTPQRTS